MTWWPPPSPDSFLFRQPDDISLLLSSAELPQLEELAILSLGFLEDTEDLDGLEDALLGHALRFKAFLVGFSDSSSLIGFSGGVWSGFKVLQDLTFDYDALFDVNLPSLSAPLARLRLRPRYDIEFRLPATYDLKDVLAALPTVSCPKRFICAHQTQGDGCSWTTSRGASSPSSAPPEGPS